jgi:hypothetical protein
VSSWPAPAAPDEPTGSPSTSSGKASGASPLSSDDRQSALLDALTENTQAMLGLVQSIRELIEYGTSQQEEAEDFPSHSLDSPPRRQS